MKMPSGSSGIAPKAAIAFSASSKLVSKPDFKSSVTSSAASASRPSCKGAARTVLSFSWLRKTGFKCRWIASSVSKLSNRGWRHPSSGDGRSRSRGVHQIHDLFEGLDPFFLRRFLVDPQRKRRNADVFVLLETRLHHFRCSKAPNFVTISSGTRFAASSRLPSIQSFWIAKASSVKPARLKASL